MTYDQVVVKLREYSDQLVTLPDNEFKRMAETVDTLLGERRDLALMIRRLLSAIDHGAVDRDRPPGSCMRNTTLYRQGFDLLTRLNLHGQPLHGSDHD